MTTIVPHLWFDNQAEDAANFYTTIFRNSSIKGDSKYITETPSNKPKGSVMTVEFELEGVPFTALNGGPYFKINPSISFIVRCTSIEETDRIWNGLAEGASILMPFDTYPFSKKYGWLQDKFGVSWQIFYIRDQSVNQKIIPKLMFIGDNCGKASEAMDFYISIFKEGQKEGIMTYGANEFSESPDSISHAEFSVESFEFAVMDSALDHKFNFNEGVSFLRICQTQQEIDYYWNKLSAIKSAEQCGWLKDKYGVSWQIIPSGMSEILNNLDPSKSEKAMKAILAMKKIDIETLKMAIK